MLDSLHGKDGEAGVQVPLLSVRRTGAGTGSHVRLRAVRLQPSTGRTIPRLHPGTEADRLCRIRPLAGGVAARPGNRVAFGNGIRSTTAGNPATATAFLNFWSKRSKYPKFKSRHKSRASATYTTFGFSYRDGQIKLAKMKESLDIRWSRPLPDGSEPSQVTVSKDSAGRYHISILVETTVEMDSPVTGSVGIDAGITSLLTESTGTKHINPKHEQRERDRLAKYQRRLAHKQKGSKNRERARLKVARIHARIADRRRDNLHKITTNLIRENQTVMIEDLAVRNMVKNHSLARAISDAGWSQFRSMLEYKAEWYGREVIAIDRFYPSSKTCSACGHLLAKMPLQIREWTCPGCGVIHDRDVNAAKVIQAVGLTVSACGDGVRLPST